MKKRKESSALATQHSGYIKLYSSHLFIYIYIYNIVLEMFQLFLSRTDFAPCFDFFDSLKSSPCPFTHNVPEDNMI